MSRIKSLCAVMGSLGTQSYITTADITHHITPHHSTHHTTHHSTHHITPHITAHITHTVHKKSRCLACKMFQKVHFSTDSSNNCRTTTHLHPSCPTSCHSASEPSAPLTAAWHPAHKHKSRASLYHVTRHTSCVYTTQCKIIAGEWRWWKNKSTLFHLLA